MSHQDRLIILLLTVYSILLKMSVTLITRRPEREEVILTENVAYLRRWSKSFVIWIFLIVYSTRNNSSIISACFMLKTKTHSFSKDTPSDDGLFRSLPG